MVKVLRPGQEWTADDLERYTEELDISFTQKQLERLDARAAELGISRHDLLELLLNEAANPDDEDIEQCLAALAADGLNVFRGINSNLAMFEARARKRKDTRMLEIAQRLRIGGDAMIAAYTDVALLLANKDDGQSH